MKASSDAALEFGLGNITWSNRLYSGSLPNNFEAELLILRRGQEWFCEVVTVGELLLQLLEWLNSAEVGVLSDFCHHSVDTDDNPIFSITADQTALWRLESAAGRFEDRADLSGAEVVAFVTALAQTVQAALESQFGDVHIAW